jgi:hypothetical protein
MINFEIEDKFKGDPTHNYSGKFLIFYYMFLFMYGLALTHMVVVSVIPEGGNVGAQAAFTTPLVISSLLIPFHMAIRVRTNRNTIQIRRRRDYNSFGRSGSILFRMGLYWRFNGNSVATDDRRLLQSYH